MDNARPTKFPGLADMADKIETVARDHPDYSRVVDVVRVFCDHLRALDRLTVLQNRLAQSPSHHSQSPMQSSRP